MPFDGNGNWSSNFSAQADRDAGYKILASRFDNIFIADLTNAFNNCVTRDGQGVMQTNTNANNYRVINVADPVAEKDAVNLQTANAKDALCVHLAGTETITGDKTFSGSTTFTGNVSFSNADVKESLVALGMPNYSAAVSKSKDTLYTADSNGYLIGFDYYGYTGSATCYVYIDGVNVRISSSQDNYATNTWCYPIAKGSEYSFSGGAYMQMQFVPCIGG